MAKLIVAFHNFVNAPNKLPVVIANRLLNFSKGNQIRIIAKE
jgi:hypothetical protein